MSTPMATVSINGRRVEAVVGRSLFECADSLEVKVPSSCPRAGTCHECIVQVLSGMDALELRTEEESFLGGDFRLACQARIRTADQDVVAASLRREQQIVAEGSADLREHWELAPSTRRDGANVVRDGQIIDDYRGAILGLAVDIGTTTVSASLMDLESGATVALTSFENPQTFGGSDVMHRIHYDGQHPGELQRVLVSFLNAELKAMPGDRDQLYEVMVVGNPTMRDLFLGLDVQSLGQKPFKSQTEHDRDAGRASSTAVTRKPKDLGLRMSPAGAVFGAPLIACHVGADAAACILATRLHEAVEPAMIMDIGTNTEVILGNKDRLLCASCAAGPAFEGGKIRYGMSGIEGAIQSVRLRNRHVEISTIGDVQPTGICGSGLIDLIAELVRHGRVNGRGRFTGDAKECVIDEATGITFAESDVQELAQAKGATHAGTSLLLKHFPLPLADLTTLYLAGGFANYIDVDNSRLIGLTPDLPPDRLHKMGNAAAEGAKELLLSVNKRQELDRVVGSIEHLELESDEDFFTYFVEGCLFGEN
ncbi:MAG: ferredoxin [Armatimonadetes bacterium CG06_land_8_20_14_3_00_66_21]|nr:MAG: ferredoxin [Armatimonadetes bacterium CG06_land_8_20_14_3_00_66_21]